MSNFGGSAPCKGCGNRFVGCHANCPDYKAWKEKVEAIKEKEREEVKTSDLMSDRNKRTMWKSWRWQNQRKRTGH